MNISQPRDPVEDIAEIRSIMERSTRILSLSGLAGISVGIVALCGVFLFHLLRVHAAPEELIRDSVLLALGVLLASIVLSFTLSNRLARRQGLPLWNKPARLLVIELAIPLAAGGAVCAALILHGAFQFLASAMLTFYGMALLNASKFTVREVRWLGLTQIVLGVVAAFYPNIGLALWATGFGAVHMLYGMRIYIRYEK